jgi:hypothetical protein
MENRDRICKRLRSPGIDSASLCSRADPHDKQVVVVQARQTGNRFLGPLKGLQIGALNVKWERVRYCTDSTFLYMCMKDVKHR